MFASIISALAAGTIVYLYLSTRLPSDRESPAPAAQINLPIPAPGSTIPDAQTALDWIHGNADDPRRDSAHAFSFIHGWDLFQNNEFGFEFKNPSDLRIAVTQSYRGAILYPDKFPAGRFLHIYMLSKQEEQDFDIMMEIFERAEMGNSIPFDDEDGKHALMLRPRNVGGTQAKISDEFPHAQEGQIRQQVFVNHGKYTFIFSYTANNKEVLETRRPIFEKFLAGIRFFEPVYPY